MKALVYRGPRKIEFCNEADPIPERDEIVVKVEAVGICGSDMHAYLGHDERRPAPLILGHEASGEALSGKYEGQKVVINPLVTCGVCDDCFGGRANLCTKRQIISMPPRQGAFAEKVRVPESNILPIPNDMDAAHAALVEPIATALHAVGVSERTLWRPLGETKALVIGGGAVGLSAALILASRGAAKIVIADTNPGRRETARSSGFSEIMDPSLTECACESEFGLVIDAVGGGATRRFGAGAIRPGGVFIHIGLMNNDEGLDVRKFTLQEVTFIGTYTYTMVDFRSTIDAIHRGVLGELRWIEKRSLAEGVSAFDDLHNGRTAASKIILLP